MRLMSGFKNLMNDDRMNWASNAASMMWTFEASFDHWINGGQTGRASAPNTQMRQRCPDDTIIVARIDDRIIRSSFINRSPMSQSGS
jgi:hypothetical protein